MYRDSSGGPLVGERRRFVQWTSFVRSGYSVREAFPLFSWSCGSSWRRSCASWPMWEEENNGRGTKFANRFVDVIVHPSSLSQ